MKPDTLYKKGTLSIKKAYLTGIYLLVVIVIASCVSVSNGDKLSGEYKESETYYATVNDVPDFDGETKFVAINRNVPKFNDEELKAQPFEAYSELDSLGRCGVAFACIGLSIMPTEERGAIGQAKPSGWHTVKYDIVDGKYLYNRCHLIGYQLAGENANVKNLITGTRYMNNDGMLAFENLVADYVRDTNNHVLYRVTPIFDEDCLVARGVQIEARSIEDNGKGILFNVYVYNAQPGISINYYNGESVLGDGVKFDKPQDVAIRYVLNTSSKKFHKADCSSTGKIKEENKEISTESRDFLISNGYSPCGVCNP